MPAAKALDLAAEKDLDLVKIAPQATPPVCKIIDYGKYKFEQTKREKEARTLHELGVKKLYMHLDGWGQPGYDNQHPDYTPACKEAGGWEGMKSLVDAF